MSEKNVADNKSNKFIELSEYFTFEKAKSTEHRYFVQLTANGILMRRLAADIYDTEEQKIINYVDIVGVRCTEQPLPTNTTQNPITACKQQTCAKVNKTTEHKKTTAYLQIFAYIKQHQPARRLRTVKVLPFSHAAQQQSNYEAAMLWQQTILHNKQLSCLHDNDNNNDYDADNWRKRLPLLILLNPKSGAGKARELFHKQMLPVLRDAEKPYELIITTSQNSAREILSSRSDILHLYSGVAVLSGDGLFYEVLNGIMARADRQQLCAHLPMGIVPCGSGNALASSIAYLYKQPIETQKVLHATLNCIGGNAVPMDIAKVTLGNNQVVYSFCSISWGLIADIDIESEVLRRIGASRFTIWTIHRLLSLRTYKGRLKYLPYNTDVFYDAVAQQETVETSMHKTYKSQFSTLDTAEEAGWVCEEGDFVLVNASLIPRLSEDALAAPQSQLNDGIMYLMIVRAGMGRRELLESFLKLETGNHIPQQPHKYISMLPVTAFHLEPLTNTEGILTIDGERVHYGAIQAEILAGAVKVLVPPTA